MNYEKSGQEPAFPADREMQELCPNCFGWNVGMSKRFYAACAAMQGILSSDQNQGDWMSLEVVAEKAFEYADELLKQENL
jgi:hypothetical protein